MSQSSAGGGGPHPAAGPDQAVGIQLLVRALLHRHRVLRVGPLEALLRRAALLPPLLVLVRAVEDGAVPPGRNWQRRLANTFRCFDLVLIWYSAPFHLSVRRLQEPNSIYFPGDP